MAVQTSVRQFLAGGVAGDIVVSGPVRAQAGILATETAANNVIGRALTHVANSDTNLVVGGTGAFAGILANSKQYALVGNGLAPSMVLPNGIIVEGVTMCSGIMVSLANTGAIGDGIEFSQSDGSLKANSTGTASSGYTLIPGAKIVRFNATAAGLAIIELTPSSMVVVESES